MSGITKLMTAGGGGVALTPASSIASDVTVQVPSQNCTLGIQGPAFSAYQSSAQSVSAATVTKIQFQTEEFDTANCFDNATNYRFTPNVAGYYQINGAFKVNATITANQALVCWIYKNGSVYKGQTTRPAGSNNASANVSSIVYLNGTTDYVEIYGYADMGSSGTTTIDATYFNGVLIRGA